MEDGHEAFYALNKFFFLFFLNYVTWWLWKQLSTVFGVILTKLRAFLHITREVWRNSSRIIILEQR